MTESPTISWTLTCRFCKTPFLSNEADKTKSGDYLICPTCKGWSGLEMKRRRARINKTTIHDPGQNRLILELWAWVVVDPKTNLEGVCGFMVDGIPKMAITSSYEEALRMGPYVKAAESCTGKTFKLVRYDKRMMEENND